MKIILSAAACALLAGAAPAQVVMNVAPTVTTNLLRQGTSVRLRTLTTLNSKEVRTGQMFDLETIDDVVVDGHIVIPRGSHAQGDVTFAKGKGMWGKSGKIETQLRSVSANGVTIPLRGTVALKGETGTVGVVGAIAFLPIAGFFVTGTSAELPAGTSFTGFIVNDLQLTCGSVAPMPGIATAPVAASMLRNTTTVVPAAVATPAVRPAAAEYVPAPTVVTLKTKG